MTRTCSTSHTGSIHANAFGGRDTHMHTHIVDKSNFKKPLLMTEEVLKESPLNLAVSVQWKY